ncbi:MAG: hypothetical protein EOM24_30540 [Chloroflexia bacterium]|nr:hypothetical protein [Chloroflexia bacterium]
MKKIIALFLGLVLVLLCTYAVAETAVDKAEVGTQLVIWVLCGILSALGALATWAVRSYVLPWLKDVAVPWLKQRNLLTAAQVAVEYAEGVVGRFNGEEKLQLALTILESRGWVKSDEVLQALKAKWVELDLQQIAAGVKEVVGTGGTES